MGLQNFEKKLERLVEGVFAKAFPSGLQPAELGRRLTREMDHQRQVGVRGMVAPNCFVFEMATEDHERLSRGADTLARELASEARQHARTHSYSFIGPVEVRFAEPQRDVTPGTFRLSATMVEGEGGRPAAVITPDGQRVELRSKPILIGREDDCTIVIHPDDKEASRRHAEIRRLGDGFAIADLGSVNGTRVNGSGITERELTGGEKISIGRSTFRFEVG
ncbi:MAG TPA: DUF3662 and FHA domain-containing protein [Acidimicrobiales bacterium]|nr:DUF3662 and FHA domain-containing protein [Acidimicrobiales bacterium]